MCEFHNLLPFSITSSKELLSLFYIILEILYLLIWQGLNFLSLLPNSIFAIFLWCLIDTKPMKFTFNPCWADCATISERLDAKAMFQVSFPKTFVFPAINLFHFTKPFLHVMFVVTSVEFTSIWRQVVSKTMEFILLPLSLINCTILPFFCSKATVFAFRKRPFVIITLGTFCFTKTMLFIECKFSYIDISLQVRWFTATIGSSKRKKTLILDPIVQLKPAKTMRLA